MGPHEVSNAMVGKHDCMHTLTAAEPYMLEALDRLVSSPRE